MAAITLVDICDDMLFEIFLRLPWSSLCAARLGAAPFHRVISERFFFPLYRRLHTPVLGFFYYRPPSGLPRFYPTVRSTSLSAAVNRGDFSLRLFFCNKHRLIDSCGGFLLFALPGGDFYYVCNPSTRKLAVIPVPIFWIGELHPFHLGIISTDPSSFLIVRATQLRQHEYGNGIIFLVVETFSSETQKWVYSVSRNHVEEALQDDSPAPSGAFLVEGVIYFLHSQTRVLAYDWKTKDFSLIPLPRPATRLFNIHQGCLGLSEGRLRYAWADDRHLRVWTLTGGCPYVSWGNELVIEWPEGLLSKIRNFRNNLTPRVWRHPDYRQCVRAHQVHAVAPVGFHLDDPNIIYLALANTVLAFQLRTKEMKLLCGSSNSEWLVPRVFLYEMPQVPVGSRALEKDDSCA